MTVKILPSIGSNGAVQLRGGVIPEAGTVEYCVGGEWKAACDSNWDYKDAFVVCRQLGYPATGNNKKNRASNCSIDSHMCMLTYTQTLPYKFTCMDAL